VNTHGHYKAVEVVLEQNENCMRPFDSAGLDGVVDSKASASVDKKMAQFSLSPP
jgi:hypothetical protein